MDEDTEGDKWVEMVQADRERKDSGGELSI